ncbi:hypothetical protein ALI144C_31345 [Actinosynnema sp. ALI-1.44]|uniref:class I tRNA ligase family protein n=1 Tax=Actinosynnema sp. ALI-1.44 TaxID=1933779 RepID=UPI00097CBE5D|nr:class I tRNA ligase family protein [Actinosynnema sp. ALI-1.44]ONI77903.1 hypothetical protein ALI144C_31345 [Actinosynnema sp. ALI-1.44]
MTADTGTTVVLSPPPTPNGPLHLGHLAGPYLAADVAVRAARRRGERVLAVCGLDDHQNYVLARSRQLNRNVHELRHHHAALIRGVFHNAHLSHDVFVEPLADPRYRRTVARFVDELMASEALAVTEWSTPACPNCPGIPHHAYVSGRCGHCGAIANGGTCEGCAGYLSAADLVDPTCTRCGSPATASTTVRGPVLHLEHHRDALTTVWCRAAVPPRVRELARRLLADRLPTVPFSYPTDWGIPLPSFPGHRIDVWAEMGLGYLHVIGSRISPDATSVADHVAAWRDVASVWAFLGIDNAFYYLALFPALFVAAGLPADVIGGLVVNEFYRLDGAKFSTSRDHAVWAHELLAEQDPRAVRAFLAWDRPAPHATDFTLDRYRRAIAGWSAPSDPAEIDPAELARAEQALTLPHFDLALAARCLLGAGLTTDPTGALALITGAPAGSAPQAAPTLTR